MLRIGIDLGGTKIEAIAIDANGTELYRQRIATPRHDYSATITAIQQLVAAIETQTHSSASVGVGIPGAISPRTGLVKNANSTWLNGKPFDRDLSQALGREVRVSNDANCFTISEATDGAAQHADVVFGVIIGTGTGGGLVIHKQGITGQNAICGEWGHNPLPWPQQDEIPGPACYCGKCGCIETYLSGPGMLHDYQRLGGTTAGVALEICQQAQDGDKLAMTVLQRYQDRLARSLATVINLFDPDSIVLGGGMSNIASLYDTVPSLWQKYVFSDNVQTHLSPPQHGDSSGVRGAAWLWPATIK